MKNPENNQWNKRLPEHLPNKSLWGKISSEKLLETQIKNLKENLPVKYPKENLWMGIEKGLKKRKIIALWSRIASAAAIFLIGIWGIILLDFPPSEPKTRYLQTIISEELGETIPQTNLVFIPKNQEKSLEDKTPQTKTLPDKSVEMEKQKLPQVQVEITIPEILIAEAESETDTIFEVPKTSNGSKKIIAVNWDKPDRRIKIDGFNVELSEKELEAINDLNNRKKGKFRLQINELTARLYEQ
ncbi:hypothetical protein SAMN06295967_103112 [Belliella buryatensis]|uniref:Uncharacterized protein n=1 Tax=Belliella buryatensis TaxID=1500549 RepID=A0A239BP32_9BACT|nr:hypothetical protein [Belliella buryatensis]SNS09118.1 hypothetical protein SAMN06295967_103112 [Belliella buryatensis]